MRLATGSIFLSNFTCQHLTDKLSKFTAMLFVSREELSAHFISNGNRFTNSEGMKITWLEEWGVFTLFGFYRKDQGGPSHFGSIKMCISTSEESLDDFIKGFEIRKIEDIYKLGYKNSWMRYLNGYAEIGVAPRELEATLTFRLYKSRTLISSLDLHFYDEASKHLTLPEDFLKYISENERPLQAAVENRYKVSRR